LINGWSNKLLSRWALAGNLIRPRQSHASPTAATNLGTRHVDIVLAACPEIALRSALATAGALPMVMTAIDYHPLALGYVMSLAPRRHRATSRRDFVAWRFSDAGPVYASISSSRRHLKTCTIAPVPVDPAQRRRTSNCGRLDSREDYGRFQLDQG
jgi:hypothetical protein